MGKKTETGRSKLVWLFLVPLAATLIGAAVATYAFPGWFGPRDGLAVAPSWPAMEVCDSTAVAGSPGAAPPTPSTQPLDRETVAQDGGGAWGSGNLTLLVTPAGDKQIVVRSITSEVKPVEEAPEWIVMYLAQCGGMSYREFDLNLDTASITDNGVVGDSQQARLAPQTNGSDAFVVDAEQAASVVVAASACKGSYDFWLDIAYTVSGATTTDHKKIGPYRVYGGEDLLADPQIEVYGSPEAGQPKLPFRCGADSASTAPALQEGASPRAAQSAVIPPGTCGDGSTYGWDQRYPIQLTNGTGEEFDEAGIGAGVLESRFVGAADVNRDGADDAVLVLTCTGSPIDQCCAGRSSIQDYIVVLDLSGEEPSRIGNVITAPFADDLEGNGSREIDGATVTLDGVSIRTRVTLTYPDEMSPEEVESYEGWYRFSYTEGRWDGIAD